MTMVDVIQDICSDDKSLCEAILDLYKKVPDRTTYASVGARLWRCIEDNYKANRLGAILAQKGMMVPRGVTMRVAGALFRIYAGRGNPSSIVTFNPAVGDSLADRIMINVSPWVSQYYQTHSVGYNDNYNDIAYNILSEHKDELIALIDQTLSDKANRQDFVDMSIDRIKEMYSTEPEV